MLIFGILCGWHVYLFFCQLTCLSPKLEHTGSLFNLAANFNKTKDKRIFHFVPISLFFLGNHELHATMHWAAHTKRAVAYLHAVINAYIGKVYLDLLDKASKAN